MLALNNSDITVNLDKVEDGVTSVTVHYLDGFSVAKSLKSMQNALWDALHKSGYLQGKCYQAIRFNLDAPIGASKVWLSMELVWAPEVPSLVAS